MAISPPPLKRRRLSSAIPSAAKGTTIFSWNLNGIAPFIQPSITSFFSKANSGPPKKSNNGSKDEDASHARSGSKDQDTPHAPSLRDFLRRHDWPAMLFLQEVKINPDDKATIAAVERAVGRQKDEGVDSPDYSARFCLPSDKFNARGFGRKVYGVCTIIREDFYQSCVTAVRPVSWDHEGRFLVTETEDVGQAPKLAFINCYAVNGTDNPYKDPQTGRPSGTRHDRKLQVHALLQAECRRLEAEGFACVIAGDLNVARSPMDGFPNLRTFPKQHSINRADFEARFFSDDGEGAERSSAGLGMIDTFRHLHPERRGYTYYPRTRKFGDSCDRVDMILVSKTLGTSVSAAGMHETPADRGPSDHVPLYATLEFGSASQTDA